jgi:hypothetical protein
MEGLRTYFSNLNYYSQMLTPHKKLRPYQLTPAQAIIEAVRRNTQPSTFNLDPSSFPPPNEFAVVFSRQAGKDEMTAQLLAYLLTLYREAGGQVVLAAPTEKQANISRDRLLARLKHPLNAGYLRSREGYIVGLGAAEARFLSAEPSANVRGETASLLLVANEAQDILPQRWDAVFDPMAASTNATTLFMGTVWTANTLLARQMRYLRQLERDDGQQRVFQVDWQEVARYVPAYGRRVEARIAQLGPTHPFVQTEYCLKELDGDGGLFGPERRALMVGSHPRQVRAEPSKSYALLVDVAGENETGLEGAELRAQSPRQDSTAVTVVEIVRAEGLEAAATLPSYRVVNRYVWTGVKHAELLGRLVGLARDTWQARYVVVDATGIGATLASFLQTRLGEQRVRPFVFSQKSKSDLGWNFCGLVDSGRYKEYADDGAADTAWFWRQLAAVEYQVRPGPGQLMSWSVPDPTLHDDLVMSAALVTLLDEQDWRPRRARQIQG